MFALILIAAVIAIVLILMTLDAILAYGTGRGAKDMYTLELAANLIARIKA